MTTQEIVVFLIQSAISLSGIIITALITNSITKYRVEQLEKKVEKHNSVIERVYKLEQKVEDVI